MAQYKVGNKILDDEEYEFEAISIWGFWLFVIGSFFAAAFMRDVMPDDWSKELRYGIMISFAVGVGSGLAYLSVYIRQLFYMGLFVAAVTGALYFAWSVI